MKTITLFHRGLAATAAFVLAAQGAGAQTVVDPDNVTATDVITKPLADVNLRKDEVPPLLIAARNNPYGTAGLRGCPAIQAEVRRLDAVLGDDIDIAQDKSLGEKRGNTVANIARSVVGSLIPFGGVIREISGANENERQWAIALYAGSVRRAYLKGVGAQKGCRYPARAASAADIALIKQARAKEVAAKDAERRSAEPRQQRR
ncbi:hypothetical protein [Novosphingobium huizhouense]|uniref:hypothetical protein n=1 Tax=Novosphingobium huizhouense TaxID=2866625 RepID=UPI001CD8EF1C|nr:hypothetical protein [Novosphingobium huizhouense]